MSIKQQKIHTQVLSGGLLTITSDMGIRIVSMTLKSGAASVIGSLPIGAIPSTPIPLELGETITLNVDSGYTTMEGVTIDATAGVVHLIARQ